MANCQPSPSMADCEPSVSVDVEVSTGPPKLDILVQEERPDAPQRVEPTAEIDSGGGQDSSTRSGVLNLPSAPLRSGWDVQQKIQAGCANLRTFLTPSFKGLRFLSPIREGSPLGGEVVRGKPRELTGAHAIEEIQPYRAVLQALLNDVDMSTIESEPPPNFSCADFTLEASCLQLDGEAPGKLELRSPHFDGKAKGNGGVEESATTLGGEGRAGAGESAVGHKASPCFNSRKGLVPLLMEKVQLLSSPGSVGCSSTSVLNGTYNLSHCQRSTTGQGLLDVQAGNITMEMASGDGPITKEGSLTQASGNNTLVLSSGASPTGSNLTVDLTEKCAVGPTSEAGVTGLLRDNSKGTPEQQSGEVAAGPNLTIDIAEQSSSATWSEDSRRSLGLKNGTFEVLSDSPQEPVGGANLTVDQAPPNIAGPKMVSTGEGVGAQNVTVELHPGQLHQPTVEVNLTFNKSTQLPSEDDPVRVCEADGGAEALLGSLAKGGNCVGDCSPSKDQEDRAGCSSWSLDSLLDSTANFLITSTPLVVPKVLSITANPGPSDACKRLPLVDHSEACPENDGNDGLASAPAGQPPPAQPKPPSKALSRPTGLPSKYGVRAQPPNRKSPACPSDIPIPNPKSLHPPPRSSSSRLSLAPPPKSQAPGNGSFLSSALSRIGRKTGGALRNMAASGSLEVSVGSTSIRRRDSVSENKLPGSGLQKPRVPVQASAPAASLMVLRPTGQTVSRLPTQRADPKGKGTLPPTSTLKQPRGNAEETLPLSKRKKVDALAHAKTGEAVGSSAGSQPGLRRPATRLRAPQSKLQTSGGSQITGALTHKKSGLAAPVLSGVQPAQDAPPSAMTGPGEDDPGLTNQGAETQGTDCENCAKYRDEIARWRAAFFELQEGNQQNS